MLEYKAIFRCCKVLCIYNVRNMLVERKLSRSGNGWSLFIPKTIIELLKIDPETDHVEFIVENDVLKIKRAQQKMIE